MTQDAVAGARAAADSLAAAAARVADEFGDTLGVRRLVSDVGRIREDLDLLGDPKPGHRPVSREELVEIDDSPYDDNLWDDSDSEAQHAQ